MMNRKMALQLRKNGRERCRQEMRFGRRNGGRKERKEEEDDNDER